MTKEYILLFLNLIIGINEMMFDFKIKIFSILDHWKTWNDGRLELQLRFLRDIL